MTTPKALTAEQLIAAKSREIAPKAPPKKALEELRKLIEHNDGATHSNARIGRDKAREMLAGYGWPSGVVAFNRMVAREFGRPW